MKLAIMQPYFLPYVGYFQLIAAVDMFIVYDNIKFTKKGWINRNRFLRNGEEAIFTLPLKGDSDSLDIVQRQLATNFNCENLLNQLAGAYRKAPYFEQTIPLLERIVQCADRNLFGFVHHSIVKICEHLNIGTEIRISSEIGIDHELKGQDKVLALCNAVGSEIYVNPIGGWDLYSHDEFRARGLELMFIKSKPFGYTQFENQFVPWLSIVDVLMFNSSSRIRSEILPSYELLGSA